VQTMTAFGSFKIRRLKKEVKDLIHGGQETFHHMYLTQPAY
jgi:hypothetical protein